MKPGIPRNVAIAAQPSIRTYQTASAPERVALDQTSFKGNHFNEVHLIYFKR